MPVDETVSHPLVAAFGLSRLSLEFASSNRLNRQREKDGFRLQILCWRNERELCRHWCFQRQEHDCRHAAFGRDGDPALWGGTHWCWVVRVVQTARGLGGRDPRSDGGYRELPFAGCQLPLRFRFLRLRCKCHAGTWLREQQSAEGKDRQEGRSQTSQLRPWPLADAAQIHQKTRYGLCWKPLAGNTSNAPKYRPCSKTT